jgi:hypothetical protein
MTQGQHHYMFRFRDRYEYAVVAIGAFNAEDRAVQLGTGFYVANGVVATAAHLFSEIDGFSDLFVMQRSDRDHFDIHPAGRPSVNHHFDVAAFEVRFNGCGSCESHPVLSIMGLEPLIDEISGAFGFPMTTIEVDEYAARVVTTMKMTYSAGRVLDVVSDPVPHIPGGAFITNFVIDPGGSGGPVFNSNGFVTAIYSTGVDTEAGHGEPSSSVVAIRHALDLSLVDDDAHLLNVGELVRSRAGWNGRGPNVYYERREG